ncbi:hypothetical protein [Celeribacter halophilus]|uniref:hypothetical protein n=1 Tax=Celeribacter halophilus TaxID=576117 RepID=UPI003A8D39B0
MTVCDAHGTGGISGENRAHAHRTGLKAHGFQNTQAQVKLAQVKLAQGKLASARDPYS